MRRLAIEVFWRTAFAIPLSILSAGSATAHIVLAEANAPAGSYHAAFFRVSHECEGSATVELRIELPAATVIAKPQPKPGGTVTVERALLRTPVIAEGKPVRERVVAVTWSGRLGDDMFDQFGIMLKLPAATGLLYLPTVQRCEHGEVRWTTIPAPGQTWRSVSHPPPMLEIRAGGEDGMHMRH